MTFDGVNDYLATSNLAGTLGGTATLTAWLKTTQVGNVKMYNAPGIAGVEQFNGANDIFWGWLDETGRIAIKVGDNVNVARSTSPVNDGQWHHVAFTRDAASGVIKLYVDGVLNATATSDTGLKTTPFASFGRIEDTGGTINYLAGSLDEIRVYNRVLSDAEVHDGEERRGRAASADGGDGVRVGPGVPGDLERVRAGREGHEQRREAGRGRAR